MKGKVQSLNDVFFWEGLTAALGGSREEAIEQEKQLLMRLGGHLVSAPAGKVPSRNLGRRRPGSKGHPDHQAKVEQLGEKARSEAAAGERVLQERRIQGHDSGRIPDQQIVGADNKTRKVFEAERQPKSKRYKRKLEEFDELVIEHETSPLD